MFNINTKPSLYRDFALLSALIIFMLFLVSIWVSYKTYQEHSADILKQLENESVRIDRALIIEIERASYLLESIARQINSEGSEDISNIQQLFNSFDKSSYPRNSEFFWIDADQKILISSREGILEKPIDVSDRDYMKRAITSPWNIHIGQPTEGRVTSKWVMPIAIGLTDTEDHFRGVVLISLDINSFSREIHKVIQQDGINFAITNSAFTLLTEISEKPYFFEKHFDLKQLAKLDFSESPNGTYSRASFWDKDNIFAYYEKSSQYPYIIFVGYDANASREIVHGILFPRLLQIGIITIFLVSILWTVRKRIIQPVIALTDRTAQIVRGKSFSREQGAGPLEIEMLADEISRIYNYIQERRRIEHELSAKNTELLKIRESAEMTNQIKAQFFEQVGNALMQPASAISEYAESFHNELFGPMGSQKYTDVAEKLHWQAAIILDLLQDVLNISRAESGLLALQESEIELPLVIKKCIRLLHERSRFQSVEVVQDYDEELPQLWADELRIKQLLLNLLSGASGQLKAGDVIRIRSTLLREGMAIRMEYTIPEHRHDDEIHRRQCLRPAQASIWRKA
jgi:signal transduction histidine kinase